MMRVAWAPVLKRGAELVGSYDTGVTLRQLFYRLIAENAIPNLQSYYRRLHTPKSCRLRARRGKNSDAK
jgi:hypothetical protein